jgi:hypothetical protein
VFWDHGMKIYSHFTTRSTIRFKQAGQFIGDFKSGLLTWWNLYHFETRFEGGALIKSTQHPHKPIHNQNGSTSARSIWWQTARLARQVVIRQAGTGL